MCQASLQIRGGSGRSSGCDCSGASRGTAGRRLGERAAERAAVSRSSSTKRSSASASSCSSGSCPSGAPPYSMAALTAANALAIFSSGLQAVQPRQLVARALQLTTTEANEPCLQVAGQAPIPLRPHGRLLLLAFGKAVLAMAQAVAEMLGAQLSRAVVLVPTGTPQPLLDAAVGRHPQMHIYTGAHHNQPDQATMVGAR